MKPFFYSLQYSTATAPNHLRQHSFIAVPMEIFTHHLTLIRAAGGVYDFRSFEEVYLCNGLSSELQNSCMPQKTSREYILLSTLE